MTQSTKFLGSCWRIEDELAPGASVVLTVPSTGFPTVQLTVPSGGSVTVHGSCDDTATVTAEDAFPLVGEDGLVSAIGVTRTMAIPFPGPLRKIFLTADAGNVGNVRVVVLQ